jgi:hypothetical protein
MTATTIQSTRLRRITPPRAGTALRTLLLALLPLLLLAGCAVQFVSPYDALTDEAIQQAVLKAETIFAKVTATNASHAQTREEYRELDAMLNVIATRASIAGKKNQSELDLIKQIQAEMADLEAFHRDVAPYRASRIAITRVNFAALLHHEKGKKAATAAATGGGTP